VYTIPTNQTSGLIFFTLPNFENILICKYHSYILKICHILIKYCKCYKCESGNTLYLVISKQMKVGVPTVLSQLLHRT
jgi:hypothetical protein